MDQKRAKIHRLIRNGKRWTGGTLVRKANIPPPFPKTQLDHITLGDAFRITCQHRNKMNDMSITMMIDSPFSETITSFNTFELSYGFTKPWWEDDLPNILGINPLENKMLTARVLQMC